jgi:hypothetical protein
MTEPLITLDAWIAAHYAEGSRPSVKTVRTWAAAGKLVPAPEKQGRSYYIARNARYIDPRAPTRRPTILELIRAS